MHVAGFPGSHVVVRNTDDNFPQSFPQTLIDAAILAAINSKAPQSGRIQVSYTRCRNVTKPSNAKAGLVRLNGEVAMKSVDVKAEVKRLDRLKLTKE